MTTTDPAPTPNPFTTLSPEQAEALPPLREELAQAFADTVKEAAALGGTGVFHIAGQPRIAIESVQRGPEGETLVPIELTGVPGGPVFTFHLARSDVRALMIALTREPGDAQ
jgi:hypothetical protein